MTPSCLENRELALAAAAILDDAVADARRGVPQVGIHPFAAKALAELTKTGFIPDPAANDAKAHFKALAEATGHWGPTQHLEHIRDAFNWAATGGFINCVLGPD